MTESGERKAQDKTAQVDLAELEELRRLKIVQESKAELVAWAKQWSVIITITVAVLGLIGLNVLVATVVRNFVAEEIKEAQKTAIIATESLGRARIEMEKATKAATEYTGIVDQMKSRAEKVDKSFQKLQASLDGKGRAVREEARSLTEDLQLRLEVIEKRLASVIAESTSETKAAKFLKETERLDREAATRRDAFLRNSEYTIQIFYEDSNDTVRPIASALEKLGFQTTIEPSRSYLEESAGVPKGTFFEATKIIVGYDPGHDSIANLVAKTIETVTGKGTVKTFKGPQSSFPKWMVLFLPREK